MMGRVRLQCLEKSECLGTNSTGYHKKITFINLYYTSDFLTEGMGFQVSGFLVSGLVVGCRRVSFISFMKVNAL